MSTEDMKSLIRDYVEDVWNRGSLDALADLTTPDFVYQLGDLTRDLEGMKQFVRITRTGFPDWRVRIVDMIAEGSTVAIRWDGEATHLGHLFKVPPTGKRVKLFGNNIYRITNRKIAAEWEQSDSLGLFVQLGVVTTVLWK